MRGRAAILGMLLCLPARSPAQQGGELPPLNPAEQQTIDLLEDSSFEEPEAGVWRFSDWPPRPETGARLIADSVRFTTEQSHYGERSLIFDLTTVGADRTLIADQRLAGEALAPHEGRRMRLSASVLLASGPTPQRVMLTMRQWGEGGPPIDHEAVRMTADVNEWSTWSREFTFRMGETRRGDVNVTVGQSPDLENRPVVYVDDVRLEVLAEPPLAGTLLTGQVLMTPEGTVPVEVVVSAQAWEAGLRGLGWDLCSPNGLRTHAHGEMMLPSRSSILNVPVADIPEGRHALRLALGAEPGERQVEVLLPFRRAEGPFAR
ncbi:MAG: hypothetical protein U9R79_21670 [Armatimonadota bacterium]|nr:hypothetical protein [Armatimonadota bacterium]